MADRSGLRGFVSGIASNAAWEILKSPAMGTVVSAFLISLFQYLRHRPVDWWGVLILSMVSGLIIFISIRKSHRHEVAMSKRFDEKLSKQRTEILSQVPSFTVNGVPLAGPVVAVQKETANRPPVSMFSPLQIDCISLARDLKSFLAVMPPPDTNALQIMRQSRDTLDWTQRMLNRTEEMEAWSERLGHAYASRFSLRITNLIHRLGAEGIDVSELEQYDKWVGSDDNVNAAIRTLRRLAFEVEDRDETRVP
jgi:hypothetical protein